MSNSELFSLSENQEEEIKSAVAAQPSSKDPKGCPDITQSSRLLDFQEFQDLPRENGNEREHEDGGCSNHGRSTTSSNPTGDGDDDDDDGFKTPTSLKHKIPAMTTCPPAPKKTQIFTRKVKKSSVIVLKDPRRTLQFDGSLEVDYLFSPVFLEGLCRKIKKSRRGGGAE